MLYWIQGNTSSGRPFVSNYVSNFSKETWFYTLRAAIHMVPFLASKALLLTTRQDDNKKWWIFNWFLYHIFISTYIFHPIVFDCDETFCQIQNSYRCDIGKISIILNDLKSEYSFDTATWPIPCHRQQLHWFTFQKLLTVNHFRGSLIL